MVDAHVATVGPAQFLQPLHEAHYASLAFWIIPGEAAQEEADSAPCLGHRRQESSPRTTWRAGRASERAPALA
jgi:hypothetical protein